MEKIAVIYWSGTGNTAVMAEEIAKGIHDGGAEASVFAVSDFKGNISEYSKIAFGCPSMGDEVLEEYEFEPFFSEIEGSLGGKKIALFGSYGWGDGRWMREWEERVNNKNANLYDSGLLINEAPDNDGKAQCIAFGKAFAQF